MSMLCKPNIPQNSLSGPYFGDCTPHDVFYCCVPFVFRKI